MAFVFTGAGLMTATPWPILFGLVFLAEELIETGIMILALRSQEREAWKESGSTRS